MWKFPGSTPLSRPTHGTLASRAVSGAWIAVLVLTYGCSSDQEYSGGSDAAGSTDGLVPVDGGTDSTPGDATPGDTGSDATDSGMDPSITVSGGGYTFTLLDTGDGYAQLTRGGQCVQWWQNALTETDCNVTYHAQHFRIKTAAADKATIHSRVDGLCLSASPFAMEACNGSSVQQWLLHSPFDDSIPCIALNEVAGTSFNGSFVEPQWTVSWLDNANSRCSLLHGDGAPFTIWRSTEYNGGATGAYYPLGQEPWSAKGTTFDYSVSTNASGVTTVGLQLDFLHHDDCNLASAGYTCPSCSCRSREYNIIQFSEKHDGRGRLLGEDWIMDVDLRALASDTATQKYPFQGSVRLGCGIIAKDPNNNGYKYFVEVTFLVDGPVDKCGTGPSQWGPYPSSSCDPDDSYYRRSNWGTGETYYVKASRVGDKVAGTTNLSMVSADGSWQTHSLPLTRLVTNYPNWVVPSPNWSQVELVATGCMIESLGEASAQVEVRGLRTRVAGSP